jgi:hypothetical protein
MLTRDSALFYWSAEYGVAPIVGGDPVFSRDSAGTMLDRQRGLRSLIRNLPRQEWVTVDGVGRPGLLVELAKTNDWSHGRALDNAVWTKASLSVSADQVLAPDGALTADKLVEDTSASGHYLSRATPSLTAGGKSALSLRARAGERSWVRVQTIRADGSGPRTWFDVANGVIGTSEAGHTARITGPDAFGFYRCVVAFDHGGTTGAATVRIGPTTGNEISTWTGDGVSGLYVWGVGIEIGASFASSDILSDTAATTRAVDQMHWTGAPKPQAIAGYGRLVKGMADDGGLVSPRILQFGSAADADPRFILYFKSAALRILVHNGSSTDNQGATLASAPDDGIEYAWVLNSDGSARIFVSKNGAAVVSSLTTAALSGGLPSAWSADLLWLGSVGGSFIGRNHHAELKIVKLPDLGATTDQGRMDELRDYVLDPAGNLI